MRESGEAYSLQKSEELFQSLMQRVFRGEGYQIKD
jgi:hypothetical protein